MSRYDDDGGGGWFGPATAQVANFHRDDLARHQVT
jgi:hypothetical protein